MRDNHSGPKSWIGAGVVMAVIAALVAPAVAASARPEPARRAPAVAQPGNAVIVQSPANYARQHAHGYAHARKSSGPCYPFGCDYRGPSYPFGNHYTKAPVRAVPTYVVPNHGGRRWVAAHWAQQWVPQYYVYQVWVPGYYSNAGWVQGYYEDRTAESGGYYQQVWLDGYWEE